MAAEEVAATPKVSLKLIVDTKSQRVLFAEAGKEFIDFLFNTLSLPLATVVRLLTKQQMVGSFSNLYQSIENLNQSYIQPNQQKDTLLKPISPISSLPFLPLGDATTTCMAAKTSFYRCGYAHCSYRMAYVADNTSAVCPGCNSRLDTAVTFVNPPAPAPLAAGKSDGEGGFVKGVVTYLVMDDLAVTPLSIISSINMINKFNVKDLSSLEERLVDVGMEEGVKLLKESLQSKTVLTNVFLEKKTPKNIPVV